MQRPRLASVHSVTYHAARHQIATSSSGCLLMEPYKVHLSHIMSRRAGVTAGGRWGSDAVPDAIFGGRARIRAVVGPRGPDAGRHRAWSAGASGRRTGRERRAPVRTGRYVPLGAGTRPAEELPHAPAGCGTGARAPGSNGPQRGSWKMNVPLT